MAKRSSGGGGLWLTIIGGVVVAAIQYGRELLILAGVMFALWALIKLIGSSSSGSSASQVSASTPSDPLVRPVASRPRSTARVTSTNGDQFWTVPNLDGEEIAAHVYLGSGLGAASGSGIEPALIDASLPRDRSVRDCTERRLSYWPSYSTADPQARAAYLNWLKGGLKDPAADMGYVFLYFYGLERRSLHDARTSEVAKAELPAIRIEVQRLLKIYSGNRSFRTYASSLLDLLDNQAVEPRLYESPPPALADRGGLGFRHKVALGQCAADGKPLPAEWAYNWLLAAPEAVLRRPVTRCREEFRSLFMIRYQQVHGDGLKLPRNRTLLSLERLPASPTFGGPAFHGHTLKYDLPDVSVLTSPLKALQEVADYCADRLEGYSRFIGKNPSMVATVDAIVEMPIQLWPEERQKPLKQARELVTGAQRPLAIPFEKMKAWLPEWHTVNKAKYQTFCRVLGEIGLGIEPDPRFGGAVPSDDSTVVVFADDATAPRAAATSQYLAAALTLQLASAVAVADGDVGDSERELLSKRLEQALELNDSERRRLHAHYRLQLANPPKLTGLKSRIESLSFEQRDAIGHFLTLVAAADEVVSAKEVKVLEKVFKQLQLDPKSVYSKLHVAATEPVTVQPATDPGGRPIPKPAGPTQMGGIQLDRTKIAMLERDSARVSAMLSEIFNQPAPETSPEAEVPERSPVETMIGLDGIHSEFLRTLLSRMTWSRANLEELAADRGLMLDGSLERINEAAFDKFDKPLFEGDDPVEMNVETIRELGEWKESAPESATQ
jgi:uncharacterized tellurite resistance protein B-like protein